MQKQKIEQVAYRPKEAAQYLGVSRSKFYELASTEAGFPRKIRYSSKCVVYLREDLYAWIESKKTNPYGAPRPDQI